MNKYLIIVKMIFLIVLSSAVFNSCVNEEGIDTPDVKTSQEVTFSFRIPVHSTATRGLDDDDEYNVSSIDVLVFEHKANGDGDFLYTAYGKNKTQPNKTTINFNVALQEIENVSEYDFVILANARQIVADNMSQFKNKGKKEVQELITDQITEGSGWITNKSNSNYKDMPMWGELIKQKLAKPYEYKGAVLTRMTAKVDLKIDLKDDHGNPDLTNTFALEEVWLYNYNTKGYLIPDADKFSNSEVSVPSGVITSVPINYTTLLRGGKLIDEVYTYEAVKGSIDDYEDNFCFVIKGSGTYKGEAVSGWYRIDFANYNGDKVNYIPVRRNHHYNVAIARISGDGYEEKEEAFNSKPGNIGVAISSWVSGDLNDIISDGQYTLQVNHSLFEPYKEATNIALEIMTNYDVSPNAGWKITDIKTDTNDGEWLKAADGSPLSGIANKTETIIFEVKENTGAKERVGEILINAGRIKHTIKVVQSTDSEPVAYAIDITSDGFNEIVDVVFVGEAAHDPDAQEFHVQWLPIGSTIVTTISENDLEAKIIKNKETGEPFPSSIEWRKEGYTFVVDPGPIGEYGDIEFFEKSLKIVFSLTTDNGAMTKTLNIRQTNFNLLPGKTGLCFLNGQRQSMRVRANFTWRAQLHEIRDDTGKTYDDTEILATPYEVQYGGNNTLQGDALSFTCKDFIETFDATVNKPREIILSFKFQRFENGNWVDWPDMFEVPVYGAINVGKSNSYIIDNDRPMPIMIPVSQMLIAVDDNKSKNDMLWSWVDDGSNLDVAIFWSDIQDGTSKRPLVNSPLAVVQSVKLDRQPTLEKSSILVYPGKGIGNAGIVLYEKKSSGEGFNYNEDVIRWSWHIWNIPYFPYDKEQFKQGNIVPYDTWLDRNIGATTSTHSDMTSFGFYYQWGRKDPFPAPSRMDAGKDYIHNVWYADGVEHFNEHVYSNNSYVESHKTNLEYSVKNPATRIHVYSFTQALNWFSASYDNESYNLWGGVSNGGYVINNKSVYDPCPEGYMVPASNAWSGVPDEQVGLSFYFPDRGGYYPKGGRLYAAETERKLTEFNSRVYCWSRTHSSTKGNALSLINTSTITSYCALGYNVRCIKQ